MKHFYPEQRFPLKIINPLIELLQKGGHTSGHIDSDTILSDAVRTTGLSCRDGNGLTNRFERLIDSLNKSNEFHPLGRIFAKHYIAGFMINRIRVQNLIKKHPDSSNENMEKPLFIIGLPRSGSTFLQNVLAQDPYNICINYWEAHQPSRKRFNGSDGSNSHRKYSDRLIKLKHYLSPQLRSIHEFSADGPEECTPLMMGDFSCRAWGFVFDIPEYDSWLNDYDYISTYEYHRTFLEMLKGKKSGSRWILKSPCHLSALEAFMSAYPDALIVHIHRDPLEVIPSTCSLALAVRSIFNRRINTHELGEHMVKIFSHDMDRYLLSRGKNNGLPVCDIAFSDLINNPISTVRDIYEYFGFSLSSDILAGMRRWIEYFVNKRHYNHECSLEQFNLNSKYVHKYFEKYMNTFEVLLNSKISTH